MESRKITIKEFKKEFGTEAACLRKLLEYRKPENGRCINPKCDGLIEKFYKQIKGRKAFICRRCLHHFHPLVGTPFEGSHLELPDLFEILFMTLSCRSGIPAFEIYRNYGYSYPTALRLLNTIRKFMGECLNFIFTDTIVEVDESYVSTGKKGMSRHHKFGPGRGSGLNTSFLAIIERVGHARLFVIPSTNSASIIPKILANISKSTIIVTDQWPSYKILSQLGYQHVVVNHDLTYVDDLASTNSAENLFSNVKRMIMGTYRNVSENNLQNYLNEASFRHCYREDKTYGMEVLLKSLTPLSESYKRKYAA